MRTFRVKIAQRRAPASRYIVAFVLIWPTPMMQQRSRFSLCIVHYVTSTVIASSSHTQIKTLWLAKWVIELWKYSCSIRASGWGSWVQLFLAYFNSEYIHNGCNLYLYVENVGGGILGQDPATEVTHLEWNQLQVFSSVQFFYFIYLSLKVCMNGSSFLPWSRAQRYHMPSMHS